MKDLSSALIHFAKALSIYEASFSGHLKPAFIAAAALGLSLTKFLNSSDYYSSLVPRC
jgi:hypothetical protein